MTKRYRDFNLNVNFDVFCRAVAADGDFSCGLDQLCRACSILAQSGRSRKRAADRSFVVVAEKSCTRCQEFKPADEFPRDKYGAGAEARCNSHALTHRYMADGLYIYCKPCTSEMKKLQREKRQHRLVSRPAPTTKICRRCHERKRLVEFRRSPSTIDGHAGVCKCCQTSEERDRRAAVSGSVSLASVASAGSVDDGSTVELEAEHVALLLGLAGTA